MLFRFSLYGFLKNQRYFEAFLVLAFLDKGLDFFAIGLLVALRELTVNLCEVPSGVVADVFGRRGSMIFAFAAYIASFLTFGFADALPLLMIGMVLYGFGEAFRSGTHKAMIFAWLRSQGREAERVRVYGFTRSWSKFGSAFSVVAATVIVVLSGGYDVVFFASVIPYALGIVNFLAYPKTLDGDRAGPPGLRVLVRHFADTSRAALRHGPLRRLFLESMGFDGVFTAVKDYLQPALEAVAISAAASLVATGVDPGAADARRTALFVGPVYFVLYLLAGAASRMSHRLTETSGGEGGASRALWVAVATVYAGMLAAAALGAAWPLIASFVLLHVVHNLWRPILIGRFDTHGDIAQGASLMSVESQGRRVATMFVAPVLGLAVDLAREHDPATSMWPVGCVGLAIAIVFVVAGRARGGGDGRG